MLIRQDRFCPRRGTRDGVELLPSGYIEYMAERPRSHGLFSDENDVDLSAAMKDGNSNVR